MLAHWRVAYIDIFIYIMGMKLFFKGRKKYIDKSKCMCYIHCMKIIKVAITNLNRVPYLRTPCLYTWRRNGQWLYVGASMHGTKRLNQHHIINIASFIPGDIINIFIMSMPITWDELQTKEYYLIKKHKPLYNKNVRVPMLEKIRLMALEKLWIQKHSV